MTSYIVPTLVFGVLALATAWLPIMLRSLPLSLPVLAMAFGWASATFAGLFGGVLGQRALIEPFTGYVLAIAVMGAGLKIDRPFAVAVWASTWRLLLVAMPLSIGAVAILAHLLLGFAPALALLAGAILSPTDPVLASEVQAGPPGQGEDGEVRFALTSEAGLNDGLAMPFVALALALVGGQEATPGNLLHWLLVDVVWEIAAGAALGALCGWGLIRLNRLLPEAIRLSKSRDGLAVLGVSFIVYAIAALVHANAFVAVFATAVAFRNTARSVDYARDLHTFGDQIERLLMVIAMAAFGALLAFGLLAKMSWTMAGLIVLILFAVRPASVFIGAVGSRTPFVVNAAVGYFGVRGIGSFYYLAFALNRMTIDDSGRLTALVAGSALTSAVVYGLSSGMIMAYLDDERHRAEPLYRGRVLGPDPEDGTGR